jgi:hypothetical protein
MSTDARRSLQHRNLVFPVQEVTAGKARDSRSKNGYFHGFLVNPIAIICPVYDLPDASDHHTEKNLFTVIQSCIDTVARVLEAEYREENLWH